jgi:hypothetical protein
MDLNDYQKDKGWKTGSGRPETPQCLGANITAEVENNRWKNVRKLTQAHGDN